jgi:phage portal protein BeeE
MNPDSKDALRRDLERRYSGWENAYKTLVMDQGADMKVVGSDFVQMEFIEQQKSNEGRIASAGGVPPIIVSFRSGLDAATYSNYGLAMRAFADHTIRPSWNSVTGALSQMMKVPAGSELWYDDSDVAALRQDAKDAAAIKKEDALTMESLIRGGFVPDTAKQAVITGDFELLQHTGLVSVQLMPPGEGTTSNNGSQPAEEVTV